MADREARQARRRLRHRRRCGRDATSTVRRRRGDAAERRRERRLADRLPGERGVGDWATTARPPGSRRDEQYELGPGPACRGLDRDVGDSGGGAAGPRQFGRIGARLERRAWRTARTTPLRRGELSSAPARRPSARPSRFAQDRAAANSVRRVLSWPAPKTSLATAVIGARLDLEARIVEQFGKAFRIGLGGEREVVGEAERPVQGGMAALGAAARLLGAVARRAEPVAEARIRRHDRRDVLDFVAFLELFGKRGEGRIAGPGPSASTACAGGTGRPSAPASAPSVASFQLITPQMASIVSPVLDSGIKCRDRACTRRSC